MTRGTIVRLCGAAGALGGLVWLSALALEQTKPFGYLWDYLRDDYTPVVIAGFVLMVLGVVGHAVRSVEVGGTSAPLAAVAAVLALVGMVGVLIGMTSNWTMVMLGFYLAMLAFFTMGLSALYSDRPAVALVLLLMVGAVLAPFMNMLDARIWLAVPLGVGWVAFGLHLLLWRARSSRTAIA